MIGKIEKIDGLTIQRPLSPEEKLESPGPYTALIRGALDFAVESRASDIHFESTNEGVEIRIRIAGLLEVFHSSHGDILTSLSPRTLRKSFFMELKRIANLSLGKFGVAQDSRISLERRRIEVRVNLIPTIFGEKVVFRLFFKDRSFSLERTGYQGEALLDIRSVINKTSGLIILSGETGSGKTTTLYSILNEIDRKVLNVSSLEDPVEHIFEGVNHTQVSERFTFADGLRALLRQDPDVMLVGEIRDGETAKLVNRAAQTGHLVLSTVHTNRALNIPAVFEFYGVAREEVIPNILLGANQRLLRKLCVHCAQDVPMTEFKRANPLGCVSCRNGYQRERQVLFEYFLAGSEIEKLNLKRKMKEEVFEYAKAGVIDYDEIQDHCDLLECRDSSESLSK